MIASSLAFWKAGRCHACRQVREVAFSPDGATLATAGGDEVILWDLARLNELRASALERACRAVGTGLRREEWASFVPDVPYEQTCPP